MTIILGTRSYDRSTYAYGSFTRSSYYANSGGDTYGPYLSTGEIRRTNYDIGVSLSSHQKVLDAGEDATTSRLVCDYGLNGSDENVFSSVSVHYTFDSGAHTGLVQVEGTLAGFSLFRDSFSNSLPTFRDSSLRGRANREMLKKMMQKQRQFQGGPFIGELAKTIRSFVRPANALKHFMKNYTTKVVNGIAGIRRSRVTKNAKLAAIATLVNNSYLEFQYVVRPTLQDLDGAAKALNDFSLNQFDIIRSSGKAESKVLEEVIYPPASIDDFGLLWYDRKVVTTIEELFVTAGGIKVMVNDQGRHDLATDMGLTIREFVPTVWEILPWSFLIDYFADVGGAIDAICALSLPWVYASGSNKQVLNTEGILSFNSSLTESNGAPYGRFGFNGATNIPPYIASLHCLDRGSQFPYIGSASLWSGFRIPTGAAQLGSVTALFSDQLLVRKYLQSL